MDMVNLVVSDATAWKKWLQENDETSDGVWLLLAKKDRPGSTTLTYQEALEEALCSGWIDGQRKGLDETNFIQRFTPRRPGSAWSQRNVGLIEKLKKEARMRPQGNEQVKAAKADGRWERAYPGLASMTPPADLLALIEADEAASRGFVDLERQTLYTLLLPLFTETPEKRPRRLAGIFEKLKTLGESLI